MLFYQIGKQDRQSENQTIRQSCHHHHHHHHEQPSSKKAHVKIKNSRDIYAAAKKPQFWTQQPVSISRYPISLGVPLGVPPPHDGEPTASPTRCPSSHFASSTYNNEVIMRILSFSSKAAQSPPTPNKSPFSNVTGNTHKAKSA